MNKQYYIVVGSDNFWYGLCDTLKETKDIIKQAQDDPSSFANPESRERQKSPPDSFYVYKGIEINLYKHK